MGTHAGKRTRSMYCHARTLGRANHEHQEGVWSALQVQVDPDVLVTWSGVTEQVASLTPSQLPGRQRQGPLRLTPSPNHCVVTSYVACGPNVVLASSSFLECPQGILSFVSRNGQRSSWKELRVASRWVRQGGSGGWGSAVSRPQFLSVFNHLCFSDHVSA